MLQLGDVEILVEAPKFPTILAEPPKPSQQVTVPMLGPAGASAYEVAVKKGFVGTEEQWLASLRGGDGSTVLLLEADEPVPADTPPGTIILRKAPQ